MGWRLWHYMGALAARQFASAADGKGHGMKITIDIDCTPEEARRFLGLPDVAPVQDLVMEQVKAQMAKNLSAMDPESLLKTWVPQGLKGIEELQKAFWSQLAKSVEPKDRPSKPD